MRLHAMPSSGNSQKITLLLALLDRQVEVVALDAGSEALARAKASGLLPFDRLPVLELDDGRALPESGAILWHLAEGSRFIPADPVARAQMLAWMFWEQYSHEPVVAVRAALRCYPDRAAQATPERLADLLDRGHAVLARLDEGLSGRRWLVEDAPSLADIALYPYTSTAQTRGGYDLTRFPAILAWLDRVAALIDRPGQGA